MNRQYIGARYVPRFMGEYDPTTIYEALDVVENGLGTTYISKIPVPANTPLTNTTYWSVYGATTGAILDLQNRMQTAENDIDNIEGDITTINGSITSIEGEIASLKVNKGGKIIVIGNSYVMLGCTQELEKLFDAHYRYVDDGIGFCQYAGHSNTFETMLDNAIADADITPAEITDILFVSAMGDTRALNASAGTYRNNLKTTLASMKIKIANTFTNCHNIKVTFAESRDVAYFADNKYSSLFGVHKLFKDLLHNYNFDYIGWSGFDLLFTADNFDPDHYHLSAQGTDIVGNIIKKSYFSGIEYATKYSSGTCDFPYTAGGTVTCVVSFTPERGNIEMRGATVTQGGTVTATVNQEFVKTSDLSIPAPPPNTDIDFYCQFLRAGNGDVADFLILSLRKDANGQASFYNLQAALQANALYPSMVAPTLNCVSYII